MLFPENKIRQTGVMRPARLALLTGLCLAACLPASGATRTWVGNAVGGTGPFWNNVTNWSGFLLPNNSDDLFFPVIAGNKSSVNNLGVTNYDTIFFAGSNYVFSGGAIGLSGGIVATNREGTNVFATPMLLRASQTFSNGGLLGRAVLVFAGSLNLNGNDLRWTGSGTNRVASPLFGTGDITKGGSGELLLAASNSFSGLVLITNGSLRLGHFSSLGSTNFGVTISNANVLLNTNVSVTNKALSMGLFSDLIADGGTSTWAGAVSLTDFAAGFTARTNATLRIHGTVNDVPGEGLGISGPGTIIFSGAEANTSGNSSTAEDFVSGGVTWILDKPSGVAATVSRLRVIQDSTVRLNADDQLGGTRTVVLTDDSVLDLNNKNETIAFPADWPSPGTPPGRVVLGNSGTNLLTMGGGGFTNFSGTISGAGNIRKSGSGVWLFQGTNSATGTFTVANGALIVDGRFNTSPVVLTGGLLGGTGTVANVTLSNAAATLNPGPVSNFVGRLVITNDLSLLGGTLQLEISGTVPGILRDELRVGRTTRITNCALQVTLNFVPAAGTSITIIDNTGANAVLGHFNGLPEGAVITAGGGQLLRISYVGGTGNDVTLTKVTSIASGVARTWSGAGPNNFWLNAANWVGGTRPQGGDSLYFPPGAARLLNTNDFPPAIFDSILIGAGGYDLRGSGITLLNGLTATNGNGIATVRTPIAADADLQIGAANSSGTLNVFAAIDALTNDIQFVTQGPIVTAGPITGSGQLTKFGPGELSILGTNTLTKTNFINEGSLFVGGAVTGRVMMASGTTLSGFGYVRQVQCATGSTLTAGDLPDPNRLSIGNELRLTNGSILEVKLNGTVPGITHDQISITNASSTVVLSNATLQVDLNFTPVAGNTFTIIDQAGASAVLGTFAGLSEGAILTISNVLFRISYVGGTGNDVVLTVLSAGPTGITRAWTGAAFPSTNWSNPTNWSGNILPSPGDALFFSGTLPDVQKTNVYDLAAGTIFDRFIFGDGQCRYRIFGTTPVFLDNGIVVTNATFGPSFTVPIELFSDQIFSNTGPSGLRVTTVITDGHQLVFDGNGSFTVEGDVSGSGALVKRGSGPLRFNVATTFTGPLDVQAGSLEVNSTFSLGGAAAGTTVAEGASLVLISSSHNWGEPLTFAGTLNSGTTTNNTWSGPITLIAPEGIFDVGANGALRLTALIGGSGTLVKTGAGTLTLAAANTFAGSTLIQAGTLLANSIHTNSPVIISNAATLGGTGIVAAVTASGNIAPGLPNAPGILRMVGNLSLQAGSTLLLDLDSPAPATGYDQLNVSGTVSLSGNPPAISLGFTPALGSTFVIIDNDGADPVIGTFAGVPQGGTFVSGLGNWQVNYAGGDGNDVVLTRLSLQPTGITRVWTGGGGANTNWSNPANWQGNVAPSAGDALVFPGDISGLAFNDFPPSSIFFDSLRFGTGTVTRPSPAGNEVPLLSGILVTNFDFPPFIHTPIRLLADQSFVAQNADVAMVKIFTDGHQLTIDGNGEVSVTTIGLNGVFSHGDISGTGSVLKRGTGTLRLDATNTYTGPTIVESGVVVVRRSQAFGSTASGTTLMPGSVVRLEASSLNVPEPLTFSGGTLVVGATNFSVTGGVWSGAMTLSSNAIIDTFSNSTLNISGVISGSGGLVKTGNGSLTLAADNTYAGTTLVQSGALAISNSHLPGAVLLSSNTVLTAGGQIGSLSSTGATLGVGTLTTPGLLQVNGALNFDAATRLDVDIDGTTAGTNHDQLRVSGPVNLGGAQLLLDITVSAPIGSTFVIIRKDTPGAVTGTFAGLPQNATFTRGAFLWQIDYFAVDGNDVALRVISQSFPGVVWDGGGADSNWLTASNWLNDAAPSPGADLVFSREADQRTNINNFVAGTSFNSLRFTGIPNLSGGGFTINGNAIVIAAGLVVDTNGANTTLNLPITLGSGAPLTAQSPGSLRFNGAVNNGGFTLNPVGSGSTTFAGPISGTGGFTSAGSFVQLSATNTFTGASLIQTGTVRLNAMGAFGPPTNLVTVATPAVLQLNAAGSVLSNAISLSGAIEALSSHTLTGPVSIVGPLASMRATFGTLNISGPLSGSGDLAINFPGSSSTVILNGDSFHTGGTRLNGGTLLVNGFASDSAFFTETNSTLGGSGEVGSLAARGVVSPGAPGAPGILRVAGSATLSNTAAFVVSVNGPAPGADYDQLRVGGVVRLENAALQLIQGGFTPSPGASFTIIRNDSASPVTGTFAGLPEGGFITNCAVLQISYNGGDGNDVVLTMTPHKGLVNIWTGSGSDSNWTTAANWLCGFAPVPGDELVFSNITAKLVVQNDFPANTTFSRIRFTGFGFGNNFFLGGNPITLTDGIFDQSFANSNVLTMPITMAAPLMLSNGFNLMVLRGGITNSGNDLLLTGGGFEFVGPYAGAGGLIFSNGGFGFGQLNLRTNNSYSGPTMFSGAVTVFMDQTNGLGDPAAGTFIGENASLILRRPMTLTEPITLAGRLDFANGTNAMAAPLTIASTNALLQVASPRMEFNGPINGAGRMQLGGIATNFFTGGGNFSGTIEMFAGRQIIVGEYPGMGIVIGGTLSFSSSFEGVGRVGAIRAHDQAVNSVLAPGVNAPGILTCASLVVESNITLRLELNGTAPGTGHDQLVASNVALTNCTLELSLGFTPSPSDSFTLLNNIGANPIAGTFVGLPESATFTLNSLLFRITYVGGDGNDIVLARASINTPASFTSITLSNGLIQLQIFGAPSATYVIEAATNLLNPPALTPWAPISTNTANGAGLFQFIDANTTNFPSRFYRVASP